LKTIEINKALTIPCPHASLLPRAWGLLGPQFIWPDSMENAREHISRAAHV
jgi:hypothetical protein